MEATELDTILDDECELLSRLGNGPEFLGLCVSYPQLQEKLTKAVKLYLTPEIFEDSHKKFVDYFLRKQEAHTLWSLFTKDSTAEEIGTTLYSLTISTDDYRLDDRIKIIELLMEPKEVIRNLKDENFTSSWSDCLCPIITSCTMENLAEDSLKVANFVQSLLRRDKKLCDCFVNWIADILNTNIPKINLDTDDYDEDFVGDLDFAKTYAMFCHLFHKPGTKYLNKIDENYLTNPNCPIKWYDLKEDVEKDVQEEDKKVHYTFYTQLFFLMLDFHRIFLIPAMERVVEWKSFKEENDKKLAPYKAMKVPLPKDIQAESDFINRVISECQQIGSSLTILNWAWDFYYNMAFWINNYEPKILLDPLLDNLYSFLKHIKVDPNDPKDVKIMKEIVKLSVSILSGKITKNNELQKKYLKFIWQNTEYLELSDQNLQTMMIGILDLYSVLDKIPAVFLYKFTKKNSIYFVMEDLCFKDIKKGAFVKALDLQFWMDKARTQKFVNSVLDDINELISLLDSLLPSIGKNHFSYDFQPIEVMIYELLGQLTLMINFVNRMCQLTGFKTIIRSDEMVPIVATVINGVAKLAIQDLDISLDFVPAKYREKAENKLDLIRTLGVLHNFCLIVGANPKIYQQIVSEDIIFKIEHFDIISDLMGGDRRFFEKLIQAKTEQDELATEDVPDEFLDPITSLPIKIPVLLPTSDNEYDSGEKMFLDRSTIVRSLLKKEENPFNREKLTVQQLDDYNKSVEIKKHTEAFRKRFDEWRNQKKNYS